MRRERGPYVNILKGHLFEAVILRLLKKNGFSLISDSSYHVRENRQGFIEVMGRGTYHQIDCPCKYDNMIPFLYPIRLLGEVKHYSAPISKSEIRSFIGVVKDIQENYFPAHFEEVQNSRGDYECSFRDWRLEPRYSDFGAFFSASGFNKEAEMLAYAHGISTISYNNNPIMRPIIAILNELERNYFRASFCVSQNNLNDFAKMFGELLDGDESNIQGFIRRFEVSEGVKNKIGDLRESLVALKANFIGTAAGGILLHFVGESRFPEHLFARTDSQTCRVYVENNAESGKGFYLVINEDNERGKFYFTPPRTLEFAANMTARDLLDAKAEILLSIQIPMRINNLARNLTLKLDTEWIDQLREITKSEG
jgi:hypothetical protein